MASYCPHCGSPSPDEARFCMKCGRERLPAAETGPPPVPPALPPAPAALPVPAAPAPPSGPSPVGQFAGRVLRGDWAQPAKAALFPAGLLLVLGVALAFPSYGQDDEVVVGWVARLRIALAMLLQGVGGGFEIKAAEGGSPFGGDFGSDSGSGFGSDSGSGFGDGFGSSDAMGSASLSLVPLTVTLLFVAALYLGARMLRTRGAGLEAAVRLSLVVTVAVLVLGLFAQPDIDGVEVSSSPLLAMLGALAIALVVSFAVLQRDHLAAWLGMRPGAASTVRALGTAVRALGTVIALCSVVGFVVYAVQDDVDGTALLGALPFLPNIGFAVLGLSWGVPVEYDVQGEASAFGSSSESGAFGLSEIGDLWGNGAVAGALTLGVVCALTLGIRTALRSPDRREHLLTGAFVLGLFLLFLGFSGLAADVSGGVGDFGGQGRSEVAPSVPDAFLFGLLWVGGAVLLAPYAVKLTGRQPAVPPYASAPPPAYPPAAMTPGAAGATVAGAWPVAGAPGQGGPDEGEGHAVGADTGPPPTSGHDLPATGDAPAGQPQPAAPDDPAASDTPDAPAAPAASAVPPGAPAVPPAGDAAGAPAGPPMPGTPGGPMAPGAQGPGAPVPVYDAETYVPAGYGPHTPHTFDLAAGHATVPPPGSDQAAAARRRKVLVWTGTLVAAFVIGGGAAAGVLLLQKDDGGSDRASDKPAASPSQAPSAPASPSPSPTPSQEPTAGPGASTPPGANTTPSQPSDGTLPAGFVLKNDPAGFTVAVMDGWQRRQTGSQIFYEAPTGGSYLQIGVIKNAPTSSYENFLDLESKRQALPEVRYQRQQLVRNTFQGRPGALWEFTNIPDPEKSTVLRHVIDQAFVAADGTEYAILAGDRADLWDTENDVVFSTALGTFKPN
ncbi:zinc ribbon domain-containing protein [Streptomyces sp. NBC_01167]|uniref:zinc ribbon domain-containing protein n=1 Tax=Streptomyces sp. NBC_01167 TaxID=2903756 RepID=UPI00386E81A1|nr:zinc ribbon domain-containing protein [Streptomyces sp. NBC_01167]